jgi:hypothetical protein
MSRTNENAAAGDCGVPNADSSDQERCNNNQTETSKQYRCAAPDCTETVQRPAKGRLKQFCSDACRELETAKQAAMAFAKGATSFPPNGIASSFTGEVNLHVDPEVAAEMRNRAAAGGE